MASLPVVYCRSLTPGGFLIRAASWWDQWTHCGIVTPDSTVINARAFHGVVEESWGEFLGRYSKHTVIDMAIPNSRKALDWARAQLGRPYDYGAIVEFLTSKIARQAFDGYQCVELVESAAYVGGAERFRRPLHKITVAQSFMVK